MTPQARIAAGNALPGLVRLLRAHRLSAVTRAQPGSGGAARRAADALTNLAHENVDIKNMVGVCRVIIRSMVGGCQGAPLVPVCLLPVCMGPLAAN
jgi:hypothetical protein